MGTPTSTAVLLLLFPSPYILIDWTLHFFYFSYPLVGSAFKIFRGQPWISFSLCCEQCTFLFMYYAFMYQWTFSGCDHTVYPIPHSYPRSNYCSFLSIFSKMFYTCKRILLPFTLSVSFCICWNHKIHTVTPLLSYLIIILAVFP